MVDFCAALARNLRLPPRTRKMGRGRQQRDVPARDVGPDGVPEGRACAWVGDQSGEADDDSVRVFFAGGDMVC